MTLPLTSVNFLGGLDQEDKLIDIQAYQEIRKECSHFIYTIHRNLPIWEWPDSLVKDTLKMCLEDYLIGSLNTPESRKLHLQYKEIDWDIQKMMQMHLYDN